MKAIETKYKGYRFRSRLEARWAVFLDSFNEPWEYEIEGFELSSGRYLPDFWLPRLNSWLEIKGIEPTVIEKTLCCELAQFTNKPITIAWGLPYAVSAVTNHEIKYNYPGGKIVVKERRFLTERLLFCNEWDGEEYLTAFFALDDIGELCIRCGYEGLSLLPRKLKKCKIEPITETMVNIAKSARFEFGR